MSLGSGYRYLQSSVARGDVDRAAASGLVRYYAESGTPPGRMVGGGLAGLDDGRGVLAGALVTEPMLFRMLGMLADPVSGRGLGRAPRRWPGSLAERIAERVARLGHDQRAASDREAVVARIDAEERRRQASVARPVAGFDLTFSVPKSVSTLWALASDDVRQVILDSHRAAVDRVLRYAEEHVIFSRSGVNGVVQEDIRGVVAAAFDHWDSRAGDPHLHTHVAIMNRVQCLDGQWRSVDSRLLFKSVVALSEMHEGVVMDLLSQRLGVQWKARTRRKSPVARYDIAGVPTALLDEFSQRARQISAAKDDAVEQFKAAHGREPSAVEVLRLRQKATLDTRPDKDQVPLGERLVQWRERATDHVGPNPEAWPQSVVGAPRLELGLDPSQRVSIAQTALSAVAAKRSTFSRANVLADVHRRLHAVQFADADTRVRVGDEIADAVLADASIGGVVMLTPLDPSPAPLALQRPDGTSRLRARGAEIYTTKALLDAEERLLRAADDRAAPTADARPFVGELGVDQQAAINQIAASGRALDVLVGPAGTGKTRSIAALQRAWEREHGTSSVIGLAPSAAAAEVLGDELQIDAENIAKWLHESSRSDERRDWLADLQRAQSTLQRGTVVGRQLARRCERMAIELRRWSLTAGQLVIVDEAGMAATFDLDRLVTQATDAGAKVLLVGDWAQLAAVQAGGAFGMLARSRPDVAQLHSVRRFTNPWERDASLRLRDGDSRVADEYVAHDRIMVGSDEGMLDAAFLAWEEDTANGFDSLLLAVDIGTVHALNARARAVRVARGEVAEHGVTTADGIAIGVGDIVVTRRNNRRLGGAAGWVRNGDVWNVIAISSGGDVTVRHPRRGSAVLPADYVREHLELGYASTVHRAQGRTVDTSHAVIGMTATRDVAYVAMTRGRRSNSAYSTGAGGECGSDAGDHRQLPPAEAFGSIIQRAPRGLSAHEMWESEDATQRDRERIAGLAVGTFGGSAVESAALRLPVEAVAVGARSRVHLDESTDERSRTVTI